MLKSRVNRENGAVRWNKSGFAPSTITLAVLSSCRHVMACWLWVPCVMSYLALMRYWATLMLAGEPVIVTWRMAEPSVALAILM